jgi:hypothetical protein
MVHQSWTLHFIEVTTFKFLLNEGIEKEREKERERERERERKRERESERGSLACERVKPKSGFKPSKSQVATFK